MASIYTYECTGCGECWGKGEPFYQHPSGYACWWDYETSSFNGLRIYDYPDPSHYDIIYEAKNDCPNGCILITE